MKRINHWFKCENPGCHNERDRGYEVTVKYTVVINGIEVEKEKRIKLCEDCYAKSKNHRSQQKNYIPGDMDDKAGNRESWDSKTNPALSKNDSLCEQLTFA